MKPTMKIIMNTTAKGSPNGVTVITYEKGETYILPISLANAFLHIGAAKGIEEIEIEIPEKIKLETSNKPVKMQKAKKKMTRKKDKE